MGKATTVKLGIISDSHGRVDLVRRALGLLKKAGAEGVVHCGDVGGIDVLEEMTGWQAWFVWGNSDFPRPSWRPQVEALGLPWPDGPLELTLADRRIGVFHGYELAFQRAMAGNDFNYILHGHTHQPDDYRVGNMRIINPGALHRVRIKTIALLDLGTDRLEFMPVDDPVAVDDDECAY